MKKHVALPMAVLMALVLLDSHVDLVERDGRKALLVNNRLHDVQGWLAETGNRLVRRCDQPPTPADADARAWLDAVKQFSPPDSLDARLVRSWQLQDWAVVQVHFPHLKPALVVLQNDPDWQVLPQAVWSGSTAPWRVNDFVRRYLQQQAPAVPAGLLACVEVEPLDFMAQ